jgi:hypothetical protein
MITKPQRAQLEQLLLAGFRGVWAGDLIDKESTRELIRRGLVDNGLKRLDAPPSSLHKVYINESGRHALAQR